MYKLKRTLKLFDLLMINIGAIIGAGIFVIIGISISKAGPSVIFSIIIAAIISLLTGISFSEIALHVAKEGGVYEYAKEALTPFAGFIGGWAWISANILGMAAILLSFGGYLNVFLGTSIPILYFAIGGLLLFMTVNILGIKQSSKTITWMVLINLSVLIIFVVVGLFFFKPSNLSPFEPNGFNGVLAGTAIIFFAFTGFSRVATISDEVKEPRKNIPKAIIISIVVTTVLYLVVATVALGMLSYTQLGASLSPLSTAISVAHNNILDAVVAIGAIVATAGVAFTGILGVSRVFFAMGRDNELPKKLGIIDRFSTPTNAIILVSFLVIVAMLLIKFTTTVEISNAGILTAYAIINLAALNLFLNRRKIRKKNPNYITDSKYFPVIPIMGFVGILLVLSYLSAASLYVIAAILVVGIIYYIFKNSKTISGISAAIRKKMPGYSVVREFGPSRNKEK